MSGTSLDGIDLSINKFFNLKNKWNFEILRCKTIKYSNDWIARLNKAVLLDDHEIRKLDNDYTEYLAKVIVNFIRECNILIDFVSSHGHTIFHKPEKSFTLQIGNQKKISKLISQTVICDFRKQDLELGGQGAPLVPVGDYYLFSDFNATLNLGGFANITKFSKKIVFAYDICPVNTVLNMLSRQLNYEFDNNGELGSSGRIILDLENQLDKINFYKLKPPKSLGIEWVLENINPVISNFKSHPIRDLIHTFVIHISKKIVDQFPLKGKILITGGGAYNKFLIKNLQKLSSCDLIIPNNNLIDFKESIIFAFLGLLRIRNEINCFRTVTGAKKNHCTGKIYKKN